MGTILKLHLFDIQSNYLCGRRSHLDEMELDGGGAGRRVGWGWGWSLRCKVIVASCGRRRRPWVHGETRGPDHSHRHAGEIKMTSAPKWKRSAATCTVRETRRLAAVAFACNGNILIYSRFVRMTEVISPSLKRTLHASERVRSNQHRTE